VLTFINDKSGGTLNITTTVFLEAFLGLVPQKWNLCWRFLGHVFTLSLPFRSPNWQRRSTEDHWSQLEAFIFTAAW